MFLWMMQQVPQDYDGVLWVFGSVLRAFGGVLQAFGGVLQAVAGVLRAFLGLLWALGGVGGGLSEGQVPQADLLLRELKYWLALR